MRVRSRKEFGLLLRDYRKKRRMTQAELAESIGVSRRWVVQVEQGKTSPDLRLVFKALRSVGAEIRIRPRRLSPAAREVNDLVNSRRRNE